MVYNCVGCQDEQRHLKDVCFLILSIGRMHQSRWRYFSDAQFQTMFKVKLGPSKSWLSEDYIIYWLKMMQDFDMASREQRHIENCIRSVEIDCNLHSISIIIIINKVVYFPFQIITSHVITNDTRLITRYSLFN